MLVWGAFIIPDIFYTKILNLNIMNEQQILERAESIVSFKSHFLVYILVNVFLFGVGLYDNGHVNWAIFSLLGWALA